MTFLKSLQKNSHYLLTIFLWIFFVYFIFSLFLNIIFKKKIITNTYLGEIPLQGTNLDKAKTNIQNFSENLNSGNFVINLDNQNKLIIDNKTDQIIKFDEIKTLNILEKSNQEITLLEYPIQIFKNFFLKKNITSDVIKIDENKLGQILNTKEKELGIAKQEYNLGFINNNFYIVNKKDGVKIRTDNFGEKFFTEENFQKNSEINLFPDREIDLAKREQNSILPFINQARNLQSKIQNINLTYISNKGENKNFILNKENILESLQIKEKNNNLYLGIDENKLLENLKEIEKEIYVAPINGFVKVSEQNPKFVESLVLSKNGQALDQEKLIKDLENNLGNTNYLKIENKKIEPEKSANDFGIQELLGTGWSSFAHSDPARLHNIYNAVSKINNLLIAPDENFSLAGALAPFTNKNGYVDGLVIKGKKIIPETGGGMCQLGTTMFRSAMNSGMPITERRNHSLWLKYYVDPRNGNPGTDATIYGDSPDLKFKNDTGKYLLIKAFATKNADLYIELWGTKDGRLGSYTAPKIVNRVEPSSEMETHLVRELKPGEMICNGPFKGASTVFTYNRTLPNGEKKSEQFWSYYKAEPLRCQIGPDVGYFE